MDSVIRVTVIYIAIMTGLRILGKREFSQLSPIELVALLMIPELVSNAMQRDNASLVDGLVNVATLLTLVLITSLVAHFSKKATTIIGGSPVVLVEHGKLLPDHMNAERVTPDEVMNELHRVGLERLEQVRWAILETDGVIAIIPEPPALHQGEPESANKRHM